MMSRGGIYKGSDIHTELKYYGEGGQFKMNGKNI
jgi:hypothetical protein